jgi:septal ring factor EnvC (AmiA/AmiB activator)
MAEKSGNAKNTLESLKKELASVETKIDKTVDLLIETGSAAIKLKLAELEERKITLSAEVRRLESEVSANLYSLEKIRSLFQQAEQQLRNGTLANRRSVIDQYVDKVLVYPEKIEVYLKILGGFETKEVINIK